MSAVVEQFKGKWTETSAEGFEDFMKALDVNLVLRKVGKSTKANEQWDIEGDTITLHITSTFKNKTLIFSLGQEIDENTMDGRKVKTVFTEDGNKLIHKQTGKPHNCTYVRELQGDELVVSMTVEAPTPVTAVKRFIKASS